MNKNNFKNLDSFFREKLVKLNFDKEHHTQIANSLEKEIRSYDQNNISKWSNKYKLLLNSFIINDQGGIVPRPKKYRDPIIFNKIYYYDNYSNIVVSRKNNITKDFHKYGLHFYPRYFIYNTTTHKGYTVIHIDDYSDLENFEVKIIGLLKDDIDINLSEIKTYVNNKRSIAHSFKKIRLSKKSWSSPKIIELIENYNNTFDAYEALSSFK